MELLAVVSALVVVILLAAAAFLAIVAAGIRRQGHAGLRSRPPGFSTALARRVCGLYADLPRAVPSRSILPNDLPAPSELQRDKEVQPS